MLSESLHLQLQGLFCDIIYFTSLIWKKLSVLFSDFWFLNCGFSCCLMPMPFKVFSTFLSALGPQTAHGAPGHLVPHLLQ